MSDNPFSVDYVEPETSNEPEPDTFRADFNLGDPKPKVERPTTGIIYHPAVDQGSLEWLQLRCGLLTASEMKLIITPSLKFAENEKQRTHLYELLAQRVNGFVDENFQSFDMMRGHADEVDARDLYAANYAPVEQCGFVTNDEWGFTIGYSPDGLVGDDGLIECKSRKPKFQAQTIVEHVAKDEISDDFIIQVQTALLVTRRKWCDTISYCGGMPMATVRVWPDPKIQRAIITAATIFEERMVDARIIYDAMIASGARLIPTKRSVYASGDLK
jgi:hypothetical protein